jgi:hypothetical protein
MNFYISHLDMDHMNVHTRVTKTKNLAIYNTTVIPQIDMATFFMEEPKYKTIQTSTGGCRL